LVVATTAVLANFLTVQGLTPLYPTIARDLGLKADTFGVLLLLQGAINVLFQLPAGVVADRVGRRPMIVVGLLFMTGGQVLRWQSGTTLIFGLAQALIGFCGPLVVAASYAAVADAYPGGGRAQALGVLVAATNFGQGLGFVLAGLLGPVVGWRTYCLWGAAVPLVLVPAVLSLPGPVRAVQTQSISRALGSAFSFLIHPEAASLALVSALNLAAVVGTAYLIPFIAIRHGVQEQAVSLLLLAGLVGAVAGAPLAGRWADRAGGVRLPVLVLIGASALATLPLALLPFDLALTAACLLVLGGCTNAVLGLCAAAVVDLTARLGGGAGAALGGMRVGQGLGPALAPPVIGLLFVRSGSRPAFLALAAGLTLTGLVFARQPGRRRNSPQALQ
jgi:predicted MFS family arabinose efflux permease